ESDVQVRKENMRNSLVSIIVILLAAVLAGGQAATHTTTAKAPAHPAPQPAAHPAIPAPSVSLPSEATVDSFLQQTFGYQKDLTWKISSIKPSTVAGLAEVNVVVASPQGQQLSRLYVSSDGEHAVVGDIIPFGARPFDPA